MVSINIIVQHDIHFTLFGFGLQLKTNYTAYYQEKIRGCCKIRQMTGNRFKIIHLHPFIIIKVF